MVTPWSKIQLVSNGAEDLNKLSPVLQGLDQFFSRSFELCTMFDSSGTLELDRLHLHQNAESSEHARTDRRAELNCFLHSSNTLATHWKMEIQRTEKRERKRKRERERTLSVNLNLLVITAFQYLRIK